MKNTGNRVLGILVVLFFVMVSVAFAEDVSVYVEENKVSFEEGMGTPFIDTQDRTQVPLRAPLEAFGADVLWSQIKQTVIVRKYGIEVQIPVGKDYIIRDGQKIQNDTVSQNIQGRVYLPIRAVMEAFGAKVKWEEERRAVMITPPKSQIPFEELSLEEFLSLSVAERMSYPKMDYRLLHVLSSVKDQGDFSTCWAFASMGSLEGNLSLGNPDLDFSEDHLIWNVEDRSVNYHSGGYNFMVENYLTSGKGPVTEEEDPYGDGITNQESTSPYFVKGFLYPHESIEGLKRYLVEYGPVGASMYVGEIDEKTGEDTLYRYFDTKNHSFYYDGVLETNHDVVIVGWDDNFPKEHFIRPAPMDGAWIVKNSYGEEWGEKGYFYISYADTRFPIDPGVVSRIEERGEKEKIYFHDPNGYQSTLGYQDQDADYMASVFQRHEEGEKITEIGVNVATENVRYSLYVIPSYVDNNMSLKRAIKVAEGVFWEKGYHVVTLPVAYTIDEKFAVIAELYTEDASMRLTIDPFADGNLKNDVFPDQSYTSGDGVYWQEGYNEFDSEDSYDVCLRAYTK